MSDDKIVPFRPPEISAEDRARFLQAEVERLARLSVTEWLFWLSKSAEQHGVEEAKLKQMVAAQISDNDKKKREAKAEQQKREAKAEKLRASERREQERQQRAQQQAAEKAKKAAEQEAGRKQRERAKEFAKLLRVPAAEQDARLVALAKRLDEEIDFVREEFAQFVAVEEESKVSGAVEPWPDPVETGALLTEVAAQVRRFVAVHSEEEFTAIVLWVFFAWVHEIAVHSPILVISSADEEGNAGKSTLCAVIGFLTPRSYIAAELTGPSLYRFVDHVRPTLIVDDADKLFSRKPELVHIVNIGWTRGGARVPRIERGVARWFDTFCPKLVSGVNVQMPKTTARRTISITMWPKLEDEKVEPFSHEDDDALITLRRKLSRWAADNAAALKAACPAMPAEMINGLEANWRLLLAIAELAGGSWLKAARAAASKLSRQQQRDPSEGKRMLAVFRDMFRAHGPVVTSAEVQQQLTEDPASEWADYRGRGRPITVREIALVLAPYGIRPGVVHPRGRKADRGYKVEWFEKAFRHYLKTPHDKRSSVRKSRKTLEKLA